MSKAMRRATRVGIAAFVFSTLLSPSGRAEIATGDLARIRPLAATLALEGLAADAIRRKDTKALMRIAADIRRLDAKLLAEAPSTLRNRRNTDNTDANTVTACHYAGLTLRLAILGLADGSIKPRVRADLVDTIPPEFTDQFAAHMQRCELLERTQPTLAKSARHVSSTAVAAGRVSVEPAVEPALEIDWQVCRAGGTCAQGLCADP